jgi:hypothetical protein
MKITIAGNGYVELSNAMLLSQNHEVIALDKIEQLNNKFSPIVDADIEYFLANKDLNFTATLDKELLPLQPGDVPDAYADVDDLVGRFSISYNDIDISINWTSNNPILSNRDVK